MSDKEWDHIQLRFQKRPKSPSRPKSPRTTVAKIPSEAREKILRFWSLDAWKLLFQHDFSNIKLVNLQGIQVSAAGEIFENKNKYNTTRSSLDQLDSQLL